MNEFKPGELVVLTQTYNAVQPSRNGGYKRINIKTGTFGRIVSSEQHDPSNFCMVSFDALDKLGSPIFTAYLKKATVIDLIKKRLETK